MKLLLELLQCQSPTDVFARVRSHVVDIPAGERQAHLMSFLAKAVYVARLWTIRALELGTTEDDVAAVFERDERELFEQIASQLDES